jgi:type VI protein secretion system component VasK
MDKLIVKLFGINRLNFYGWIAAGLFVIVGSLLFWAVGFFFTFADPMFALAMVLSAIWVVLIGMFGLFLQLYCALLAEKLEKKEELLTTVRNPDELAEDEAACTVTAMSPAERRATM